MRLRPQQLEADLGRALRPVYLVGGDETLLVQECADSIRTAARAAGFSERLVMHADAQFNWRQLEAAGQELSLFAERRIIDLRLPTGKPGDAGSKVLCTYCATPPPDTLLLITSGRLTADSTRSRWFKAIEQAGAAVQVWPITRSELPRWLDQRLRRAGLSAEADVIELLADRVQGNLLAAAQEVERLSLLCEDAQVTASHVTGSVGDSARFDVFAPTDRALAGDAPGALRALRGLRAEGGEVPMVLWGLARELRLLYRCARAVEAGGRADQALQAQRVPDRRRPILQKALVRLSARRLVALLDQAARVDRSLKGNGDEEPWALLEDILLELAGATSGG